MAVRERRYLCYFCGRDIATTGYDPCEVIVVTRINSPDAEQEDAAVYCHASCIAAAAAPHNYIAIPGFPSRDGRSAKTTSA